MTQVSAPEQGEMLASRYRLDTCVAGDPETGHAIWRGTDNLLNRAVEIELRIPGGDNAREMISAAVAAGRISHPTVVGVYDAVDEQSRAFVVREWVEGYTLSQAIAHEPLGPLRAAQLARAVADGIAAIHATGVAHGAINPEAVLVGIDGEITLTDLRLVPNTDLGEDIRALGGLLYAALTGHWPREATPGADPLHTGSPPTQLPDAVYVDGKLCSPRQVRAGIPAYLDALTMDLLDPAVSAPTANELATELRRYDVADPELGPLTAFEPEPAGKRPLWKRYGVPVVGLACILITVFIVAFSGFADRGKSDYPISDDPTKRKGAGGQTQVLQPSSAHIIDDPNGDQTELSGANNTIDGDPNTNWAPAAYTRPNFGNIKKGMGVLLDLGESKQVSKVTVELSDPGATLELRGGDTPEDEGNAYRSLAAAITNAPSTVEFVLQEKVRYVLVWITSLPNTREGPQSYTVAVREISLQGGTG